MNMKDSVYRFSRWFSNLFIKISKYNDIEVTPRSDTILQHDGLGVIIGRGTILGRNVSISAYVCLGERYSGSGCPVVEDDVQIKSNAIILGHITLGYGCVVGAGAVVLEDVPPKTLVVGVPARVVKHYD